MYIPHLVYLFIDGHLSCFYLLAIVKSASVNIHIWYLSTSFHFPWVYTLVQFSHSVVSDSVTPWIAARQASLSITNPRSLPRLTSIKSVMPSRHLILCHPLLLLPPIPPSIRDFSNESTLRMRWPKYWSFSFNISPSSEYPGLISFRMDWLDLLAVQGTLKSLLQQHRSKASIHSAQYTGASQTPKCTQIILKSCYNVIADSDAQVGLDILSS